MLVLRKNASRLLLAALVMLGLAACGPEDGRARGGGKGADIGNIAPDFAPRSKAFQPGGGEDDPE